MNQRKILIIDADQASLKYLAYAINKAGGTVFTASTGKDGLIAGWREKPQVIVIDPNLPDITFDELLEKLRKDRRTAKSLLIAFSSLSDPDEIQSAINKGFDHYLAKESDALPNLLAIIEELGPEHPLESKPKGTHKIHKGKIIVFLSAKGGTGTSSICANIATVIAKDEANHKVAVVDLVLPLGSIAPIVGYEGPLNIVEASEMTGAEANVEYLQKHLPETGLWGFQLLAGSPNPQMANELDVSSIPVLLNTIQQGFDYVFVDLGRSLSRISLPILTNADQIVIILSPDQSTVTLTKTVVDFLKTKGLQDSQVYLLFNRTVGLEGMPKNEIESLLSLPISGAIPFMDTNFSLANNLHVPITYKFPDDVVTITIRQVANEIRVRAHEVGELRKKAA